MEICCITIGGKEIDLVRLVQITGRSVERLKSFGSGVRGDVKMPILPPIVQEICDLGKAREAYRTAPKRRADFYLLRWLELCQTEEDLVEIRPEIPFGSELEVLFLQKATEICG